MSYRDDYKKILDNMPDQSYKRAIDILNDRGFITDEDVIFGSPMIEHDSDMIIDRLRAKGYPYELNSTGHFDSKHGAVYAIYNNDDFESELTFIDQALKPYIEEQKKKYKDL